MGFLIGAHGAAGDQGEAFLGGKCTGLASKGGIFRPQTARAHHRYGWFGKEAAVTPAEEHRRAQKPCLGAQPCRIGGVEPGEGIDPTIRRGAKIGRKPRLAIQQAKNLVSQRGGHAKRAETGGGELGEGVAGKAAAADEPPQIAKLCRREGLRVGIAQGAAQ